MADLQLTSTEQDATSQNARSLNRQVVLEEDEYTAALSTIIARDFFPSLVHLDATNNYLDALKSNDPERIDATVKQLYELQTPATSSRHPLLTPSQTPWAAGPSDTPLRTSLDSERPIKRPRYDTNMSLDEFQAKYTSEDNASFTEILDDENRKRREKYGWAWEAQKRVEVQRDRMLEERKRLLIEPSLGAGIREKLVIEAPKPAGLIEQAKDDDRLEPEERTTADEDKNDESKKDGATIEEKNAPSKGPGTALVTTHAERPSEEEKTVDVLAPAKDKRVAGVDGWNFKTRNALMFPPDADVAPYASTAAPMKGEAKVIKHGNTRLPEQEESTNELEPPSPTRSRIDAAISGTPYHPSSSKERFSLLPAVPSPKPEELGPTAVKQLMTWGSLNATPRILSKSNDLAEDLVPPSTPFRIAQPSAREALSHRLSASAAKSLRAKAAMMTGGLRSLPGVGSRTPGRPDEGSMAPPTWTPRKADAVGSLTPAARRLLDRTTASVAGTRRAEAMGKAAGWEGSTAKAKERELDKVRWTPSPAPVSRKR